MRLLAVSGAAVALCIVFAGCGDDSVTAPPADRATAQSSEPAPAPDISSPVAEHTPAGAVFDRDDHDGDRGDRGRLHTYRVTLINRSASQPISPPVVATHRRSVHVFRRGRLASSALEELAENGNQVPLVEWLQGARGVTDVVDVGMPLTRRGTTVGSFADRVTVTIRAHTGDRISVAGMLICSNDGFAGLDGAKLPRRGWCVYRARAWDAGTEQNTERSADIVDACSALGPVALAGDPNGNENDAVDMTPHRPVRRHPGIMGGADLSPDVHGFRNRIIKVVVQRMQ